MDFGVTPGLLVTLEGLDGVGKSTQMDKLRTWLSADYEVLAVREPGGTVLGEALRDLVLHQVEAASALAEFLVFAAARAEIMEQVVSPALARGAVVLMDRFIDSSVAYQAFGRGLDRDTVMAVNRMVTGGRSPDLTVWLKGPPFFQVTLDRLEQRDQAFFRQVEQGYTWLSRQEAHRWLVVDSRQDVEEIFSRIAAALVTRIQQTRGGS